MSALSVRPNPNLLPDLESNLATVQQQLNQANQELASGQSINEPSDNPAGTLALILNHAAQAQNDTFQSSVTGLTTQLQTADSALNSAVNVINQAISVGVEAGNSDLSNAQRAAIAQELTGAQQDLVGIANTSISGTYLFGGTLSETQPFTLNTSTNPPTVTYAGNSSTTSVEIATGDTVNINVPGNALFMNPAGDLLGTLSQLIGAVQSGTGIAAANTAFGTAATEFETQKTAYGTSLNQLQSTGTFLSAAETQLATQETNIDGANLDQVTTDFSQADLAYQTLLQAQSRILNLPTLLSYIQ
jgi:flagellar hook-associated protein 3 FlgL